MFEDMLCCKEQDDRIAKVTAIVDVNLWVPHHDRMIPLQRNRDL